MTPLLCRLPRNLRRGHLRNLYVTFDDGSEENVKVLCGAANGARRLTKRIGVALVTGKATAVLDYDGLPRTAVRYGRYWYMRRLNS